MSIPDIPTVPEVKGQARSGLNYHIMGTVQQVLGVDLQPNQAVFSEAGAMSWMTATIAMNTHSGGGLGGMFKRAVSGASLFIVDFSAEGVPGQVTFSTDFPGKILPFELDAGQTVIMHRHAFITAEKSVNLDIFRLALLHREADVAQRPEIRMPQAAAGQQFAQSVGRAAVQAIELGNVLQEYQVR